MRKPKNSGPAVVPARDIRDENIPITANAGTDQIDALPLSSSMGGNIVCFE